MIPASRIAFIIILWYTFESTFSVNDNTIGIIPMGLINVNKVEKDTMKKARSVFITFYQVLKYQVFQAHF